MTRHIPILVAGLVLGIPLAAAAQNNAAPANVVVPPPPPREGTVGPEQLRDFALPGTRQPSPPPAETRRPAPAPAPAPVQQTTPPPSTARPAPQPAQRGETRPPADEAAAPVETPRPAPTAAAPTVGQAPVSLAPAPLPVPETSAPLPPIAVTQQGTQENSLLPSWWPWLLVAVLAGVGLALVRRQRRKPALAGCEDEPFEPVSPGTAPPPPLPRVPASAPQAPPAAPPEAPALPTGLVTTRLRQPARMPEARAPAAVQPASGGIVSTRLRGWIELDLVVREILFDGEEAIFRVDLIIVNGGTAAARDIALEAVITNGGENQTAELAAFFDRPAAAQTALAELGPLNDTMLSHELRMPRTAIRAYEAQGKPMFVPVLAVTAAYRIASGEGRTGAAFLIGRTVPGAEKLAPLLLPTGAGRLLGLGVRRLEEAVRR